MVTFVGKQIDQYLVKEMIDRGGMAEVYLATDVDLQRQVALKVMLPELAKDQTATARFRREAEAVARLNHPNIIQIYTTGTTPGNRSYLAMQYISGGTLQQKLAELSRMGQQISAGESLFLARKVAAAMQVAHQQEIVHRDLKPSNILLRSDGEPVLTDLGIAALDTGASKLTQTGTVMGTPHYMSPEQALGRNVDGRSDIYSLGIILYELLTGNVPFAADSPLAVLHQHVNEPPLPLAHVRPGLPQTTYRIVNTCLEKEPNKRFQTAGQLVTALDQALMDEGLNTPQSISIHPTLKVAEQGRRWPIWTLAVFVVLVIVVAVGLVLLRSREIDAPEPIVDSPSPTLPVVSVTLTIPAEATISVVPTGTVSHDLGCTKIQDRFPYISESGDICFGGTQILDLVAEAGDCFEVDEISPAPNNEHFAVLLQCFEGANEAFIYRADGSDKKRVTDEWDYINYDEYVWTADEYFVYQRINSCCAVPSLDAPPTGVVWYDPETGHKSMPASLSPLVKYYVSGVASDDSLNVRSGPGVDNAIVGAIPFDGTGIEVTGLGVSNNEDLWVPISYHELSGWVNSDLIRVEGKINPPQITADLTANYLPSPPTIDGSSAEWSGTPSYSSAFLVHQDDTWDGSDDIEAFWQLGWDNDYLYAAVTVSDDIHVQTTSDTKIWQGDSVEIQFDTDLEGDRGTTLNSDDYQLNISPGDFRGIPSVHHLWRSGKDGRYQWIRENGIFIGAREQGGAGYTLEIAIPWIDLNLSPIPGRSIGFALNVSDNDRPGTAVQEVMKSTSIDRNFTYPETWGTLTLQE